MQERLRSIMRLPLLGLFFVTPALASIAHGTAMEVDQEAQVTEQESIEEVPGQAEEELSRQFSLQEPGITGVLIDRTITMTGKTFFRQFSQLSLERPVIGDVNLTIHERPSARWGSQIWITQGNRVVFEATMPPRLSDIDAYVDVAIEQVEELIIRQTIIEALDNDPDLADEEI